MKFVKLMNLMFEEILLFYFRKKSKWNILNRYLDVKSWETALCELDYFRQKEFPNIREYDLKGF